MRYEPTAHELTYLDDLDGEERLHYFISRTMENEEVWRLIDLDGWVIHEKAGRQVMQLWPYTGMAEAAAQNGEAADAVSLEYFVYHELAELAENNIDMEIFPGLKPGILMPASRLFSLYDHKLDEEQYFIEG